MNQNSIQEEIKGRSKSGNACYHLAQKLCLIVFYPKIFKIKIYRIINFMGVKLGRLH
jgi:hypothetical protein